MNQKQTIERIIEELPEQLAKFTIELKHSHGMYRHWLCGEPGNCNRHFNIVTWPGSLCYTGDMGDYLFQRTNDMVAFMRGSAMSYSYAAEKCVAHDGRLKEFNEELFEEQLATRLAETESDDEMSLAQVTEAIDGIRDEYNNYSNPPDAMKAMYESGLWDGSDIPSCETYTYHFLWCLHAIKWFCDKVAETELAAV